MKFRIENDPQPVSVPVRLERNGPNLDIYLGAFCYLAILANGSIHRREFWRNSPMHDYAVKHNMTMDVKDNIHSLALERKP